MLDRPQPDPDYTPAAICSAADTLPASGAPVGLVSQPALAPLTYRHDREGCTHRPCPIEGCGVQAALAPYAAACQTVTYRGVVVLSCRCRRSWRVEEQAAS